MKDKEMICDICRKVVKPLDSHMGNLKGKLITTHINCWSKEINKEVSICDLSKDGRCIHFFSEGELDCNGTECEKSKCMCYSEIE